MSVDILAGAEVSGIYQKSGKGSVDWGEVGIQAAIGGASGALGGGSAVLLGRAASPLMKLLGEGVGKTVVNTVAGAGANGFMYTADKLAFGGAWDAREFGGSLLGGGLGGGLGGAARPLGNLVGKGAAVSKITTAVAGAGAGATGAAANEFVSGHEVTVGALAAGAGGGAASTRFSATERLLSNPGRHVAEVDARTFGDQFLRTGAHGNHWITGGFESTVGSLTEFGVNKLVGALPGEGSGK